MYCWTLLPPEYWSGVVNNPQNRAEAIRPMVESVGGKLEGLYFVVGEDAGYVIMESPDEVGLEALTIAVQASGAAKLVKTSVVLTAEKVVEAARTAGSVGYRPPGG